MTIRTQISLDRDPQPARIQIRQTGNLARVTCNLHLLEKTSPLASPPSQNRRTATMLWTITIVLFILWVLGLVSSYTMGGWIHILLVLAVIVLIFNLLQGRRAI
jgi:fatty acid desaturase